MNVVMYIVKFPLLEIKVVLRRPSIAYQNSREYNFQLELFLNTWYLIIKQNILSETDCNVIEIDESLILVA